MVKEIKEPREAEERNESKRVQGPLVKHKGEEREGKGHLKSGLNSK